ncbi:MAG: hypothetical protein LBC72_04685 [Spirochaetaceae bacterium]|nr:hypothetical protein [Spirochaetaceae bacterium]
MAPLGVPDGTDTAGWVDLGYTSQYAAAGSTVSFYIKDGKLYTAGAWDRSHLGRLGAAPWHTFQVCSGEGSSNVVAASVSKDKLFILKNNGKVYETYKAGDNVQWREASYQ